MARAESIIARLCLVICSALLAAAAIEACANYYLWQLATVEEFNLLASVDQIKARYGDRFFSHYRVAEGQTPRFSPHHFLGHYPTPNLDNGENRHNALGFRGDPIDEKNEAYRIVALGGSTTYSTAVEDYRHSYPYLLGDYLRARGHEQVEVINAGVNGYSSYHNLMNLAFRALPLTPDLVIIYQGLNDIDTRFVHPFEAYRSDNSGYIAPFVNDTIMPAIWEYSTTLRIFGIRAGLTSPHSAINRHRHRPAASNHRDEFWRQSIRGDYPSGVFSQVSAMDMLRGNPPIHFERNLANMLTLAKAQGVEVLLLTFVMSSAFDHPQASSEEYQFALVQHNDLTRQAANATDTPLLDLEAVFPDEPSLFTDGRHMTVAGNRLRARLIGDVVISEFLS